MKKEKEQDYLQKQTKRIKKEINNKLFNSVIKHE